MASPKLKAYYAFYEGEEWGQLVHGETRGKAKLRFHNTWGDGDFTDVRLHRVPGLDDKPITYKNALDAGFQYSGYECDEDEVDEEGYLKEEYFVNECRCSTCKQ